MAVTVFINVRSAVDFSSTRLLNKQVAMRWARRNISRKRQSLAKVEGLFAHTSHIMTWALFQPLVF